MVSGSVNSLLKRAILLLFFGGWISVLSTGAGQIVSGSYRVLQATIVPAGVTVTLSLHLSSNLAEPLSLKCLGLQSSLHPGPIAVCSSILTVPANGTLDLYQQFTVSQTEYALWMRGVHPRLLMLIQDSAGASPTTIALTSRQE